MKVRRATIGSAVACIILLTVVSYQLDISSRNHPLLHRITSFARASYGETLRVFYKEIQGEEYEFGASRETTELCRNDNLTKRSAIISIWTYPAAPIGQPDLCVYHTCLGNNRSEILDILGNVKQKDYEEYLRNHHLYKELHLKNFVHHVQAISILSYVQQYPNICVRTHGNSAFLCYEDLSLYSSYSPLRDADPPDSLITTDLVWPHHFNTFSYTSRIKSVPEINSGDEMQGFPGVQFMPYVSGTVDRDRGIAEAKGVLFGNAWMGAGFAFPPTILNITLVAVHYSAAGKGTVKNNVPWFKSYIKQTGMVGARDKGTFDFLRELGIRTYFSACFTLLTTLRRNPNASRKKIIVVDVDKEYLPEIIRNDPNVTYLFANIAPKYKGDTHEKRVQYAFNLLQTYNDQAVVVITSRIHAALPATALGVPVIFFNSQNLPGGGGGRTGGLTDLMHVHNPGDKWDYDVYNMTHPKAIHWVDRLRASFWNVVRRQSRFYQDAARIFGIIPLQRLGVIDSGPPKQNLFHFILTTHLKTINWRMQRAVEYVFYHHPMATVIFHTLHDINGTKLEIFRETGYDFRIKRFNFAVLMTKMGKKLNVTGKVSSILSMTRHNGYWYSHMSDFVRMSLMYLYGGVYLDLDMYVIRPIPLSFHNVLGEQSAGSVNGAIMIFDKHSSFISNAFVRAVNTYKPAQWGTIGPGLLTTLVNIGKKGNHTITVHVSSPKVYYPYAWQFAKKCFVNIETRNFSESYTVHLNSKITSLYKFLKRGTVCSDLLTKFCIFCDEDYLEEDKATIPT